MRMWSDVGQVNAQSAVRRLRLDDVELTYVVDGSMTMYREQFFPAVPQSYWDGHPDELTSQGRVAMSAGGLLVRRNAHALLIDAGYGPVAADTPFGQIDSGALLEVLTALGLEPADIDLVAFTHLHVDHTGWAFGQESGILAPTFPRASYRVSAAELAPYRNGELPVGSPSVAEVIQPLLKRSQPVADGEEVAPGVTAVVTPGHSAGHTSYLVTTVTGRRVVVFGDVFHIPAQLANPQWPSRPDVDLAGVATARERITAELEQPSTIGFGFHFGDQSFGQVVRDQKGVARWRPVPTTIVAPPPR